MSKITNISIIRDIVYAQVCSDAGKGIYEIKGQNPNFKSCEQYKYKDKNFYLLRAIKQIENSKYIGITYYVSREEVRDNLIVYFNIKVNNIKYQMSFHSPGFEKSNIPLREYVDKTPVIRWRKRYSCRETAKTLIKIFNL